MLIRVAVVLALLPGFAACSFDSPPLRIVNDTATTVRLAACVQDGPMNRSMPPGATFTFNDSIGTRALPDDPGFACLLTQQDGRRLCLSIPKDPSWQSTNRVSRAAPTPSEDACFSRSNPHI